MTKKQALSKIHYDRVLEAYQTNDFWEFVISIGGDVITYRVYNNGSVCIH